MSRTTRFLSGVGFGYAGQALVMVTALWLTPFYLGRIGQHDYGLWLMGGQIIAYVLLLDLGVVQIVVWAVTTALSVVLVDLGAGLWGLAGAWVVAQLAAPVAWWWRLRVRWRGLLPRRLPVPERAELREHLRRGSWVSVAQV